LFRESRGNKQIEYAQNYEARTVKYSELTGSASFDNWGVVLTKEGRWCNFYTDAKLIKELFTRPCLDLKKNKLLIADLGGSEGMVVDKVRHQLKEEGIEVVPVNLDISKEVYEGRKKFPQVHHIVANILETPLKESSVDVGIARLVLQYFPREKQPELLKEIYRILQVGGKAIFLWPGWPSNKENNSKVSEVTSNFEAKIQVALGNFSSIEEALTSRHLTPSWEFAQMAREVGFEVQKLERLPIETGINGTAWVRRFCVGLDEKEAQKKQLLIDQIIREEQERGGEGVIDFFQKEGKIYYHQPYLYALLRR
jgi:SAM-dependent methyltransferase